MKKSHKKVLSVILSLCIYGSMCSMNMTVVNAKTPEIAKTDEMTKNMGPIDNGQKNGTADHIDIGVTVTASLQVGKETMKQVLTLKKADFTDSNVKITATQNGKAYTGFTYDCNKITTSSGSSGIEQHRISGSYPTGTSIEPVIYTVNLAKTVTFTSAENKVVYTIPMTFTASFHYWNSNNDCPGIRGKNSDGSPRAFYQASGLDFVLGSNAKNMGVLTITKSLTDSNEKLLDGSGKTFAFELYTTKGTEDTSDDGVIGMLQVVTGANGIGMISTNLEYGSYYIVETAQSDILGYAYENTNMGERSGKKSAVVTLNEKNTAANISVENIYKKEIVAKQVDDSITIQKVDESGETLDGAIFALYADKDCTEKITTFTAGEAMICTSDKDLEGYLPKDGESRIFYLKETDAPAGYQTDETVYSIEMSAKSNETLTGNAYVTTTNYTMTVEGKDELCIINRKSTIAEENTEHPNLSEPTGEEKEPITENPVVPEQEDEMEEKVESILPPKTDDRNDVAWYVTLMLATMTGSVIVLIKNYRRWHFENKNGMTCQTKK